MVPGMVLHPTLSLRITIITEDIMDIIILVLETIVGSLVEATIIIITIKADHRHSCLLIFLNVLSRLWEQVIIMIVIDITDPKGGIITEDQILLVVGVVVATGGGEIPKQVLIFCQ